MPGQKTRHQKLNCYLVIKIRLVLDRVSIPCLMYDTRLCQSDVKQKYITNTHMSGQKIRNQKLNSYLVMNNIGGKIYTAALSAQDIRIERYMCMHYKYINKLIIQNQNQFYYS